eukprot:765798-Pelagomonas_calceolata.AAC.3
MELANKSHLHAWCLRAKEAAFSFLAGCIFVLVLDTLALAERMALVPCTFLAFSFAGRMVAWSKQLGA